MKRYDLRKGKSSDNELIPRGQNGLTSLASFYQSGIYAEHAYPSLGPRPLDTHEDFNFLYGRVDFDLNPVFLAEDNLKQLPVNKNGDTLFALNFVVDAFNDMMTYIQRAQEAGRIQKEQSAYGEIEPKRAWVGEESIHQMYGNHMNELYTAFVSGHLNSHLEQKITNFQSFMKIFLAFVSLVGYTKPITRTGFITSFMMNPLSSGLMIELVEGKHDDDYAKYLGFIRDTNFSFFTRTCERFGFLVDKHAPWRIIADVMNPYMQEKMKAYGVYEKKEIFPTYYLKGANYEIDNLRIRFFQMYNLYVQQYPDRTILTPSSNGRTGRSSRNRVKITYEQRDVETIESLDKRFDRDYWLRVFMYLRAIECKKPYSQRQFDNSVKEAVQRRNYLGESKAIEYIEKNYRHTVEEVYKYKSEKNNLTDPEPCVILEQNINKRASFRPSFHF